MTVGDVYWVELPARGGHTQTGHRPAIIAQTSSVTSKIPTVLIIPLTSQQDALRFPGTILIESNAQNGLRNNSVALVFQLTAVDKRYITDRLGKLSDDIMRDIWANMDELTGRT